MYVCMYLWGGDITSLHIPSPATVVWTLGCDGIVDLQRESSLLQEGVAYPRCCSILRPRGGSHGGIFLTYPLPCCQPWMEGRLRKSQEGDGMGMQ